MSSALRARSARWAALTVLVLASAEARAERPLVPLESTHAIDGLVWSLAEDGVGRLWVASTSGLYVSDGLGATRVPLPAEAEGHPMVLDVDGRGVVLVLTAGADLWRLDRGRWSFAAKVSDRQLGPWLARLDEDTLVTATTDGLVRIDGATVSVVERGAVTSIWPVRPGVVGFIREGEARTIDASGRTAALLDAPPWGTARVRIGGGDPERRLWVLGASTWVFDRGRVVATTAPIPGIVRPVVDLGGGHALAAGFSGLFELAPDGAATAVWGGHVRTVQLTRAGTVLAGAQGVLRHLPGRAIEVEPTFDGLHTSRIFAEPSGRVWASTARGLFVRDGDAAWVALPCFDHMNVVNFAFDDGLVLATDLRRVRRFDAATGVCGDLSDRTGAPFTDVFALLIERGGTVWLGGSHGLSQARGRAADGHLDVDARHALGRTLDVVALGDGRVAAASAGGLFVVDGSTRTSTVIRASVRGGPMDVLVRRSGALCWVDGSSPIVTCGARDARGLVTDASTRSWTTPDRVAAYGLVEDASERLWVATSVGLYEVFGERRVTRASGLPSADVNRNALAVDGARRLWIGTVHGVAHVDPASDAFVLPSPRLRFASIVDGGVPLVPGSHGPLSPDRPVSVELVAECRRDACELEVMLDPLEPTWRRLERGVLELGYPPPGELVVHARARYARATWSTPITLRLDVDRAWWQSPIAYALASG
ncbi:hypothetical protein L6R52_42120, partial [Myxococcota bacterium]|nr:hypothetical protein [Myxococcota bacterium]